jgi:hypothetical protein
MRAGDGSARIGAACGKARVPHCGGGHGSHAGGDHGGGGHGGGGHSGGGTGEGPAIKPVPGARVSLSNGQGVRGVGKPLSKNVGVRGICQ